MRTLHPHQEEQGLVVVCFEFITTNKLIYGGKKLLSGSETC